MFGMHMSRVLRVAWWLRSRCRQPSSCRLPTTASQLPRFQVESTEQMPDLLLVPTTSTADYWLHMSGAVCCRGRCEAVVLLGMTARTPK